MGREAFQEGGGEKCPRKAGKIEICEGSGGRLDRKRGNTLFTETKSASAKKRTSALQ